MLVLLFFSAMGEALPLALMEGVPVPFEPLPPVLAFLAVASTLAVYPCLRFLPDSLPLLHTDCRHPELIYRYKTRLNEFKVI